MQKLRVDTNKGPWIGKHLVTVLVIFVIAFQVTHYYPLMPELVASHYDASGRPNGWSPKGAFFGLYVLTAAVTLLIFTASPLLLRGVPSSWISLPRREFWLSPERRERTLAFIGSQMHTFGIATVMFITLSFQLAIQANLPGSKGFDVALMWVLLAVYVLFAISWTARFVYRFFATREPLP